MPRRTISPASGMRPSLPMTYPATVSYSSTSSTSPRSKCSIRSAGSAPPSILARPSPRWTMSSSATSCSSKMSPTISSTRSSSVTTPSVPPNSSTTTARCSFWSRNSASRSSTGFVSGTKNGSRITSVSENPSAGALRIQRSMSFISTTPITSSIDSRYTGKRENPDPAAVSRTSSSDAVSGNATMSSLGVMTSRATVRVSSNTPWIISSSSSSTTPSARPCRSRASISAGPCTRPYEPASSPLRLTIGAAIPLSAHNTGDIRALNRLRGTATRWTTRSLWSSATARGTSSPRIMYSAAIASSDSRTAIVELTPLGRGRPARFRAP